MTAPVTPQRRHRKRATVAALSAIISLMTVLVAFSVPLYRLFCAATGFGGTTQRADLATGAVGNRVITVRFSTDVAPGLPWRFEPEQREVRVHLGEEKLVFFSAENLTDRPVVGHATFNVTPAKAGLYFSKIQCFCFDEERLGPRQRVDMPVDFFIDPALAEDRGASEVEAITLSYTFFRSADPEGAKDLSRFVASATPDPKRGRPSSPSAALRAIRSRRTRQARSSAGSSAASPGPFPATTTRPRCIKPGCDGPPTRSTTGSPIRASSSPARGCRYG